MQAKKIHQIVYQIHKYGSNGTQRKFIKEILRKY